MSKVFRESSYKLGASFMLFVINLVQNNDTLYSVKLFCENQNLKNAPSVMYIHGRSCFHKNRKYFQQTVATLLYKFYLLVFKKF